MFSIEFGCGVLHGLNNSSGTDFLINGDYGAGGRSKSLFFDGHPGYDFRTTDQEPAGRIDVLAADASGVVCVSLKIAVGADVGQEANESTCSAGMRAGEIKIDHGDGYSTVYIHIASAAAHVGDEVTLGQKIGTAGNTGSLSEPHFDFELRQEIEGVLVPVDPYGWVGSGVDPYEDANSLNLWLEE